MPIKELEKINFEETVDGAAKNAQEYKDYLATELIKLDAKIDAMAANVKQSSAEVQADYELRLRELKKQRQLLDQKLTEFQQASESAFETLKAGLENAWHDLVKTAQTIHDDLSRQTH